MTRQELKYLANFLKQLLQHAGYMFNDILLGCDLFTDLTT